MHSPWKQTGFKRYSKTLQRDERVSCCVCVCVCIYMCVCVNGFHRELLCHVLCSVVCSEDHVTMWTSDRIKGNKFGASGCVSLQKIFPFFLFFSIVLWGENENTRSSQRKQKRRLQTLSVKCGYMPYLFNYYFSPFSILFDFYFKCLNNEEA